jgi:hypothetical protein
MAKVYTNIIQIRGDVITVEAEDIGYNEIAEVTTARGVSLAQVIRLDGKKVFLQVFAGSKENLRPGCVSGPPAQNLAEKSTGPHISGAAKPG